MGEESHDGGSYQYAPADLRTGYLPQGYTPEPDETIASMIDRQVGDTDQLSRELESLAASLAANPDQPELQKRYDEVLSRMAYASQDVGKVAAVLAAFGLDLPGDTRIANLSGGQKTRLALASLIIAEPELLVLDEPTNHLDVEMLEWLEAWMKTFRGGVLFASHDRAFIDNTATGILEIDPVNHQMRAYAGNYTSYLEEKVAERERQWQAFKSQQEEITRLTAAVNRVRNDARHHKGGKGTGDGFAEGFFANRTKATVRKAKNIEKRVERLLSDERMEKPVSGWQMRLEFDKPVRSGNDVLQLVGLAAGYGENVLLQDVNVSLRYGARAALIGPNGSGKTTLLKTINGNIPPLSGIIRYGANVRIGYMAQEQENLDPELDVYTTILKAAPFTETTARTFLHQFLFAGDDVFKQVGRLSFGERSRLNLACLTAEGCNLFLLDEPVNHLDIPSRARFEQALRHFEGSILAVVHDRYFIQAFATDLWMVEGGRLHMGKSPNRT
jgi:ATP-binding cassette subfamily F protein 3